MSISLHAQAELKGQKASRASEPSAQPCLRGQLRSQSSRLKGRADMSLHKLHSYRTLPCRPAYRQQAAACLQLQPRAEAQIALQLLMLRHKYQNSSLSMKASTHQFPSPCHSLQGTKGALKGQLILHVLSGHNGRALRYANKGPGNLSKRYCCCFDQYRPSLSVLVIYTYGAYKLSVSRKAIVLFTYLLWVPY